MFCLCSIILISISIYKPKSIKTKLYCVINLSEMRLKCAMIIKKKKKRKQSQRLNYQMKKIVF